MMDPVVASLIAVLGLAVGSFLGVCVDRLPLHRSVIRPASHCMACGRTLTWFENVPLLSYVALKGRCLTCGTPISFVYPAVEATTACVFVLQYWQLGWQPLLAVRLVFCCAIVVLFVIDLQHRILPNVITLPGIAVGLVAALFVDPGWVDAMIGAVAGGGGLLGVAELYYRVRGEEGLGMGDVKMLAMIGAFLGWQFMLVTLVLASVLGSVIGIGILALGLGDSRYALPLGSFLAISAVSATVAGEPLMGWYVGLY